MNDEKKRSKYLVLGAGARKFFRLSTLRIPFNVLSRTMYNFDVIFFYHILIFLRHFLCKVEKSMYTTYNQDCQNKELLNLST